MNWIKKIFKKEKLKKINIMETIIGIWLKFGYLVYFIGLLGSVNIWNVSIMYGVCIGVISFIIWFVILNTFSNINEYIHK